MERDLILQRVAAQANTLHSARPPELGRRYRRDGIGRPQTPIQLLLLCEPLVGCCYRYRRRSRDVPGHPYYARQVEDKPLRALLWRRSKDLRQQRQKHRVEVLARLRLAEPSLEEELCSYIDKVFTMKRGS